MSLHRLIVAFHKASLDCFPSPLAAEEIMAACPVRAHFTISSQEQIDIRDASRPRGPFMLIANGDGIDEALAILDRQSLGSPLMVISDSEEVRKASENKGFYAHEYATPDLAMKIRELVHP